MAKLLLRPMSLILMAIFSMSAIAHDISVSNDKTEEVFSIKNISVATDGVFNFKNFEVEVPQAGLYYAELWLQPARYADGLYTTFWVYVNDVFVGKITPTFGNWQSTRITDNETLTLNEGRNTISIAAKAPEVPDVETIKLALTDSDASISSEAFETYLNDAIA